MVAYELCQPFWNAKGTTAMNYENPFGPPKQEEKSGLLPFVGTLTAGTLLGAGMSKALSKTAKDVVPPPAKKTEASPAQPPTAYEQPLGGGKKVVVEVNKPIQPGFTEEFGDDLNNLRKTDDPQFMLEIMLQNRNNELGHKWRAPKGFDEDFDALALQQQIDKGQAAEAAAQVIELAKKYGVQFGDVPDGFVFTRHHMRPTAVGGFKASNQVGQQPVKVGRQPIFHNGRVLSWGSVYNDAGDPDGLLKTMVWA